jgi:hypothetical protein
MVKLRRALNFILPVLLLAAQQAALAHVISHLDPDRPPAHERTLVHLKVCGGCVSAEKLTHPAAGNPPAITAASASYAQPIFAGYACATRAQFPYSSRAPPACL